jgi:peptidoglycan/LPS O-acetylase OafA/YrhL
MAEKHRFGNFDTIRLVAAASVIFSHAFLIADGHDKNEPFVRLTGAIIGVHGVFVFLIISGFLVTRSLKSRFHSGILRGSDFSESIQLLRSARSSAPSLLRRFSLSFR